jgi:hypothetical protein
MRAPDAIAIQDRSSNPPPILIRKALVHSTRAVRGW